jgi:hypothetical protein
VITIAQHDDRARAHTPAHSAIRRIVVSCSSTYCDVGGGAPLYSVDCAAVVIGDASRYTHTTRRQRIHHHQDHAPD